MPGYRGRVGAGRAAGVLERDGWRCVECGRAGRLEVDHVVPLEAGGEPWALENLQALCAGCHIRKTAAERPRREVPEAVRRWRDLVSELLDGTL